MSTGDSYFNLASAYRMSKTIVSRIVPETCSALWNVLQPEVLPEPDELMWKKTSLDFEKLWQFPHCVGAIDGKHVQIQAPKNSGSMFYNYKKTFSLVLLAVCDAKYNFLAVDIGAYGRQSDGSVFRNSLFGKLLLGQQLPLPPPVPLSETLATPTPFVLVGDEAFPLSSNLMRPYPGVNLNRKKRIYNYRLSRARRVIENAFGIMSSRFRCLRRPIGLSPENTTKVIKAAVVLHNFLLSQLGQQHAFAQSEEGILSCESAAFSRLKSQGSKHAIEACEIRETFANYFCSESGEVPWQDASISKVN